MSLTLLPQYVLYGVVFLVMISVLVAAHELGHYLFARMFNMGVEEFAIGFGKKPLWTYMKRSYILPIGPGDDESVHPRAHAATPEIGVVNAFEGSSPTRVIERIDTAEGPALREATDFTIRPWPLGGFVRIKGMLPEEDGSETKIPGGFYSKSPWQRFLVLFAGPLFSVLAGVLVLIPVLMFDGRETTVNQPVLGELIPNKSAARAGLKMGDRVLTVGGHAVANFYDMTVAVRNSKGSPTKFDVLRNGKPLTVVVTPYPDEKPSPVLGPDLIPTAQLLKGYKIGAFPPVRHEYLSFGAATLEAAKLPFLAAVNVFEIFAKPKDFGDNVAGPATMVQATAQAVQHGIWKVLYLAGILSISVGVFNLLPAHPLDGGQMVMALAEMLRGGKRLSIRAQLIAGGIGMTFVAALVLCVFFVDFQRLTGANQKEVPAASKK